MVPTTERRYAMTRIRAGDYLLPSNDGKTLWRISSYWEDGNAEYRDANGKWRKVTGRFWQSAKYDRPFHNAGEWTDPDFLDWDNWLTWHSGLRSRSEAVESALRG